MLSILRKASLPCIKFKLIDIQLQKHVQHHSKPFIFGKNIRITPFRSCQSKPNKEGKPKSFEYTPGMSPVDFMKHGKKKKIPVYQQMAGKRGQLISGMIISVIATGVYVLKVGPHTQLKEYTAWWYGQFEKGFKKPVTRKVRELIYEVMEEAVHLTTEEEVKTKYFMANVNDAFCWGGYVSESGVLLSIPYNFAYENSDEIDLKKMTFGPRSADPEFDRRNKLSKTLLESEEAKILQNALILSDDAKRFAIARELERAKTMTYRTNGVILPISIVIGYLLSRAVNKKFDLLRKPPHFRLRMYGIIAPAMIFFAVTLEDIYKYYQEGTLDTKVCQMGPNYAKGGIEYYDKQLKYGVAMRELVPDNLAKNAYNLHGDPWPSLLRPYKYILPTSRKEYSYSIFYAVGLVVIFAVSLSSSTWNSGNILMYFERQETKLPRKLAMPYRYENKKEVYYVRFDLMLLVESVLSDLNLSARKQDLLEIFTADSLKTVGYGYMCYNFATILGLPYFFEWNTIEDVNLKAISHNWPYHFGNRFTNHSLSFDNLELTEGELQELKQTFLLSKNAKKFAIAQKLIESDSTGNWAFYSIVPAAVFWGLNQFCVLTNNIWGMLERPTYARYAMYSVHSAMFLGALLYLFSIYQNEIDKWLDQKMILMGRDYLEGGMEFYQKEIKRGLLLRKGLGDMGPNYFDESGELERMWFEPTMKSTPDSISQSRVKEYEQLLV